MKDYHRTASTRFVLFVGGLLLFAALAPKYFGPTKIPVAALTNTPPIDGKHNNDVGVRRHRRNLLLIDTTASEEDEDNEKSLFIADQALGAACNSNLQCTTENCFFSSEGDGSNEGTCSCHPITKAGCGPGETCYRSWIDDTAPTCVPLDLPLDSVCQDNAECESGYCFYGNRPDATSGTCKCNLLTHAGCDTANNNEICYDDPGIADEPPECVDSSQFLPMGAVCSGSSLPCASGYCFPGLDETTGTCQCNVENSAGCEDGEICLWTPGQPGTPPVCVVDESNNNDLPLGSECWSNDECATDNCFYGYQLPNTPGSCRCNLVTDVGCGADEFCFDDPRIADEPPQCGPLTSRPIGAWCQDNSECASNRCFQYGSFWSSCECNSQTNAGCDESEGEVCSDEPLVDDGLPECVVPTTAEKPIGAECQENSECASNLCFFGGAIVAGEESTTESGSCACDPATGAGCQEGETCLWTPGIPGTPGTPPICSVDNGSLLPLGSECWSNDECASQSCFYGFRLPNAPGRCSCNLVTNTGCNEDDDYCFDDPRIADEPPQCGPLTSRPIGSLCEKDSECDSDRCFYGGFATNWGSCECNSQTNSGCDQDEICSDDPIAYDGLPECRSVTLQPIGASCREDWECASNRCYYGFQPFGTPGSCQCNAQTNAGCEEGEFCNDEPTYVDGLPVCTPKPCDVLTNDGCEDDEICYDNPFIANEPPQCIPATSRPIGFPCFDKLECASNRCFYGFQPPDSPGSCQCNSETNAGCDTEEICSDVPTTYDGLPECVSDTSLKPIGLSCWENAECASDRCFYGFQPPETPGSCGCNSKTNAGCEDGEVCSDEPTYVDGMPICVPRTPKPIGSSCRVDYECASSRCYYGEQLPGTPGSCRCNSVTNAGCEDGKVCSDEDTYVDGLPECVPETETQNLSIGSSCKEDSECATDHCFFGEQLPDEPGACACNRMTNAGCQEEETCSDNPDIPDLPPECFEDTEPEDVEPEGFIDWLVSVWDDFWPPFLSWLDQLLS